MRASTTVTFRTFNRSWKYALLFLVVGCFVWGGGSGRKASARLRKRSAPLAKESAPLAAHGFGHVLIIVLENQNYGDAIADPYLGSLAKQGASLSNFHQLSHPSYPNYLAMIDGKTNQPTSNQQLSLNEKTIGDLLEAKGLTWKNYAEGYPGSCFPGSSAGLYARKHVPFMSFIHDQDDCDNIVPGSELVEDLKNHALPNYMFYSPDTDDDGHDTGLAFGSKWLQGFLEPLRRDQAFLKETLVVVTFDESAGGAGDTNHVYTVLLGDMVRPGEYKERYNYFNVLRTIEENFGLSPLADGDGGAKPITNVWKAS
jgi:Phosphoesterase family